MKKKHITIRVLTQLLVPILLLSAGYEYVSSAPDKDWAAPVLPDEDCLQRWGQLDTTQKVNSWPKYLYNKTYGWFDTTHFATGNPRQIIADVGTAVANGGGVITITQGLHNGITGYTGHYQVSGQVSEQQIIDVAFGIYTDGAGVLKTGRAIFRAFCSAPIHALPSKICPANTSAFLPPPMI